MKTHDYYTCSIRNKLNVLDIQLLSYYIVTCLSMTIDRVWIDDSIC
jgi:hypothetical protein